MCDQEPAGRATVTNRAPGVPGAGGKRIDAYARMPAVRSHVAV
jgi:hypothetical protein